MRPAAFARARNSRAVSETAGHGGRGARGRLDTPTLPQATTVTAVVTTAVTRERRNALALSRALALRCVFNQTTPVGYPRSAHVVVVAVATATTMSDAPIDFSTAPADRRFPNTNQTKHCWIRYVEWKTCEEQRGEEDAECKKFARWARSLCPDEWVEEWNEQRENGVFPAPTGTSRE